MGALGAIATSDTLMFRAIDRLAVVTIATANSTTAITGVGAGTNNSMIATLSVPYLMEADYLGICIAGSTNAAAHNVYVHLTSQERY
jgi:hypothetical protein